MPASSKVACGSAPASEQARTSEEVQERPARRFGSMVPLSAGHAYASLADARSSFGDTGGGDDGAPPRLIQRVVVSAVYDLTAVHIRSSPPCGHLIANEGYDEGKRLQIEAVSYFLYNELPRLYGRGPGIPQPLTPAAPRGDRAARLRRLACPRSSLRQLRSLTTSVARLSTS